MPLLRTVFALSAHYLLAGTYGRDLGTSLPALLWRLVDLLPEGVMLRCGMTNPPYILGEPTSSGRNPFELCVSA